MIAFKNIVLTTDLSANSDAAVPYAVELAKRENGTIHLLHVYEEANYFVPEEMAVDMTEWMERARAEREKNVRQLAAKIVSQGAKVEPVVLEGNPAREIIKYAKEKQADAIVISTHGRTGLSHLFFGSVAERVVRTAEVPVLTVRAPKAAK